MISSQSGQRRVVMPLLTRDRAVMTRTRTWQESRLKPRGGLGNLETVVTELAGITGNFPPRVLRPALLVFAAENGVATAGVTTYQQGNTIRIARDYCRGRAGAAIVASFFGVPYHLADVGLGVSVDHPRCLPMKVRAGTANIIRGPAMEITEARQALAAGARALRRIAANGIDALAVGEIGAGNTTAATALLCALTGVAPRQVIGHGSGLDEWGKSHKLAAVEQALATNRPVPGRALAAMAKVGSLEIAALAGCMLQAAAWRVPVFLDGLVTMTAALVACRLAPQVRDFLLAGPASMEPGGQLAAKILGLTPLYDLGLNYGEGVGAVLACGLAKLACQITEELPAMRDFKEDFDGRLPKKVRQGS